ncbi:hypothetical protein HCH52_02375 [Oscillospiraceae bacterium HV4-5-C5C]|nr:hypothetical protein [Oscillospiraceae bacterium HV4-5-C5C]
MNTIKLSAPESCPAGLVAALELLLNAAADFCRKYELTPYGSALPQPIPRLSLYFMLSDYQSLLAKLANQSPEERCFWQNQSTDPAFPKPWTRLCLNGSTLEDPELAHLPVHQGIAINLIPLYPAYRGDFIKNACIWQRYKQLEHRLQQLVSLAAMNNRQEQTYWRLIKQRQSLLDSTGHSNTPVSTLYRLFPYNVEVSKRQPQLPLQQITAWPKALRIASEAQQSWPEFDVPEDIG